MGRDKALVEIDGVAMVVRVANVLRAAGCQPVFAVGGDRAALEALGIEFVADAYPGEGPVGGVITALASCDAPAVLVVACDVPYLTVGTVRALLERPGAEHVAVAVTDRLEPMCALWLRTALGQVRGIFAGGERRLFAVLDQLDSRQVPVNPQDLANVNAPGDLPQ